MPRQNTIVLLYICHVYSRESKIGHNTTGHHLAKNNNINLK